jgi:NRPS condensation-like uncharacterized protein
MKNTHNIKTSMIDSFMWEITKDQPSYNGLAVMALDTALDEARLVSALGKFIEIVPVAAAKPIFGTWGGYWEIKKNFDAAELFTSIETDNINELAELLGRLRKAPVDMENGPYIHVFHIRAGDKYFYAFRMHHFIGDGSSMLFMMDQIAACYRELAHDPKWTPAVSPKTERGVKQIGKQLGFRQYLTGRRLNRQKDKNQPGTVVIGDNDGIADSLHGDVENHRTVSLRLNSDTADEIRNQLKKNGYLLGDLIMAATMCTVSNWNGRKGNRPESVRTRYAVDLRRWNKSNADVANISCVKVHEAPAEILTRADEAMAHLKPRLDSERRTMGLDYMWLYRFLSFMPAAFFKRNGDLFRKQYLDGVTTNHGLTSIGTVPESLGDFGHASASSFSLLPPPVPRPNVLFLVSSFKGDLTINIGYSDLHLKKESAEMLLNSFQEQLLSVTKK